MALIEWRDDFCTGIAGIDHEHEELINQINSAYMLVSNNADKQQVIDSLGDIYGNISAHFALEEQLMRKRGYDHYEEHKADHERLLDEIGAITEYFSNTDLINEAMFEQKLGDWFQVHFKTHDSRLHNTANMSSHDEPSESVMKELIQAGKRKFLIGKGS